MSPFADFCADFFKRYFELHPTEAINYGVEGYDHLLNDYSDEAYREEKAFVEHSFKRLGLPSAVLVIEEEEEAFGKEPFNTA